MNLKNFKEQKCELLNKILNIEKILHKRILLKYKIYKYVGT